MRMHPVISMSDVHTLTCSNTTPHMGESEEWHMRESEEWQHAGGPINARQSPHSPVLPRHAFAKCPSLARLFRACLLFGQETSKTHARQHARSHSPESMLICRRYATPTDTHAAAHAGSTAVGMAVDKERSSKVKVTKASL